MHGGGGLKHMVQQWGKDRRGAVQWGMHLHGVEGGCGHAVSGWERSWACGVLDESAQKCILGGGALQAHSEAVWWGKGIHGLCSLGDCGSLTGLVAPGLVVARQPCCSVFC